MKKRIFSTYEVSYGENPPRTVFNTEVRNISLEICDDETKKLNLYLSDVSIPELNQTINLNDLPENIKKIFLQWFNLNE